MIKQTFQGDGYKCTRCKRPLLKHELPQPGLPAYCARCLRAGQPTEATTQ